MTLAEAVETLKRNCAERKICEGCPFVDNNHCQLNATLAYLWKTPTESNYDQEEIHENATVHVLRNSQTGETSIGWWENDSSNDMGAGRT